MVMIQMRDGRGERAVERDKLFAAMTAGQTHIQGDVQPLPDGPWVSAGVWYLNNSQIAPVGDVDGRRYVTEHVVTGLDLDSLLAFLGVSELLAADLGIPGTILGHNKITTPDWGCSQWGSQHIVNHIPVPPWNPDPSGKIADIITVPDWGSPLILPVVEGIEVPPWRDPAKAPVRTPVEAPVVWRRLAVEQAIPAPPKPARSRRRSGEVAPVAEPIAPAQQASARRAVAAAEKSQARRKRGSGDSAAHKAEVRRGREPAAKALPYKTATAGPVAGEILSHSTGMGLFGCVGQFMGLFALIFVVTIAADLGPLSAVSRLRALNIGTLVAGTATSAAVPEDLAAPVAATAPAPAAVDLPDRVDIQPPEGVGAMGSPKAPVTVLAFIDFHCPYSKRHAANYSRLIKDFGADIRLTVAHLPIAALHPDAEAAATLAVAAQAQGLFWPAHDLLFERAEAPWSDRDTTKALTELARDAGVRIRASQLRRRRKTEGKRILEAHRALATKHGVSGTPYTFVNGRPLRGAVTYERLREVVQAELSAATGGAQTEGGTVESQ